MSGIAAHDEFLSALPPSLAANFLRVGNCGPEL
jgi:hypothetical protein